MAKFIITATPYKENEGGSIVVHYLCYYINKYTEHDCYLLFPFQYPIIRRGNILKGICSIIKTELARRMFITKSIVDNEEYIIKKTPSNLNDYIVIYQEGVRDNPLDAKNVVRWLLHNPGNFTGNVHYNNRELYFRFGSHFDVFKIAGSKLSELYLDITVILPVYNDNENYVRKGNCYALRKGKKRCKENIPDELIIDSLEHKEVAKLFKKCERFISYDPYTAYSFLAALCGCISIVVPIENISKEKWIPDESLRYGVAYGDSPEEILWARKTLPLLIERVNNYEFNNIKNTISFTEECIEYFMS